MKIIGVIPARFKSSRFPGKPLVDICGRPMIWWVYQQCLKVPEMDELYVATDDKRIEEECRKYNMSVIMTSDKHKTGSDRVGEVTSRTEGDLYINIQGNEPCIEPGILPGTAYMGDDIIDLPCMGIAQMKACPCDATKEIIAVADFVSQYKGGDGAAREFIEWIDCT